MTEIDYGGCAFPCEGGVDSGLHPDAGMSLRDWFAGNVAANQMQINDYNVNAYQAETTARWAYMVADALIKERSK